MRTDLLIDDWSSRLLGRAGPVNIDADDLKLFLSRIKALEDALADRLRLEYERFEQRNTVGA